jgi:tetratricopeptide (TPR) repeat protein
MTSILRKLRSGRRKNRTKPTSYPDYDSSRLSIKSTDSSHTSEIDARPPRKALQHMDDDDRTHPMQEQSPSHSIASATPKSEGGRRHMINFPFVHRKSDPKINGLPNMNSDQSNNVPLKRRLRNQPQQDQQQQQQQQQTSQEEAAKPRRFLFGRMGSKMASFSTTAESKSTRMDASGNLHQQQPGDEQAMNREAERIARAAAALDSRGNELFEHGYFDKAMEAYSKALKLKRRTFHSMLEEADEVFEDDNNEVDYSKSDPKLLVSMATSINNIGYLRQRAGDATPDETMAAYNKSLRIKRKILGNDSLSVGKTLNNVGSVHYLKKDFDGAIPAYEEAMQIMQSNLGDGHPDVATVMSNMGDVHLARSDPEQGLERYRMALNIRWAAFGEKDPRVVRLLEKIARIEIGDRMTPKGADAADRKNDWDESELFDLDARPLTDELHTLHEEVEEDMQYVDLLQKRMAVDMVKDKVNILRGMRELWDDQEGLDDSMRSLSLHDDEDNPVPAGMNGSHHERTQAQLHVKDRLAKLRSRKTGDTGNDSASSLYDSGSQLLGGHDSTSSINNNWKHSRNNMCGATFYSPQGKRRTLSSMKPGELKGEVKNIRSALKLRNGINSLRSIDCDDVSLNSAFSLNSKKSQVSQVSKKSQT